MKNILIVILLVLVSSAFLINFAQAQAVAEKSSAPARFIRNIADKIANAFDSIEDVLRKIFIQRTLLQIFGLRQQVQQLGGPTIVLVTPNGGEQWPIGSMRKISWRFTEIVPKYPITRVEGQLYKGGRSIVGLFGVTGEKIYGPFEWHINEGQVPGAGDDYKIKIFASGQGDVSLGEDESDAAFSIIKSVTETGWKTFKAEKFGFEMQYPAEWVVSGPVTQGPATDPDCSVWGWEDPRGAQQLSFRHCHLLNNYEDPWIRENVLPGPNRIKIRNIKVDTRNAILYQAPKAAFEVWVCNGYKVEDSCLTIGFGQSGIDTEWVDLFQQILDSIKIGPEFDTIPRRVPARG